MEESIVLDIGTGFSRCGFVGKSKPEIILPTTCTDANEEFLESPTCFRNLHKRNDKLLFEGGEELVRLSNCLPHARERCLLHGRITNLDKYSELLQKILSNERKFNISESPLVLTEPPITPQRDRMCVMDLFFEEHNAKSLCIGLQPIFSTNYHGLETSIVVDIGLEVTHITPIRNSQAIFSASSISLFGGKMITELLLSTMIMRGYEINGMPTYNNPEPCRDSDLSTSFGKEMKELFCYSYCLVLSSEPGFHESVYHSFHGRGEREFELPDGSKFMIGEERVRCPEILFRNSGYLSWRPDLNFFCTKKHEEHHKGVCCKDYGIQNVVMNSLVKLFEKGETEDKSDSGNNNSALLLPRKEITIVLAGGTTSLEDFDLRLSDEMGEQLKKWGKENIISVKVQKNRNGTIKNWRSAAMASSLHSSSGNFVSREEFREEGVLRMNRKKFNHYAFEEGGSMYSREMMVMEDGRERMRFFISRSEEWKEFWIKIPRVGGGDEYLCIILSKCFLYQEKVL